jgi:hypothetical protein
MSERKLRVGVSLAIRAGHQSIWENGIFQNCAFLVQVLENSPLVKRAVLVNGGEGQQASDAMMLGGTGITMIGLAEAMQSLDVIIEMSALLPEDWMAAFHAKGGRCVLMKVGNDYVIDIERSMFNKPPGSLVSGKHYDAVWTLAQYESIRDYFALNARAPVRFVPHLWTPYFFDRGIASLPQGVKFGYQPGREHWRVCCFEPNICMVKTGLIPMLACEEAYRARPAFLESLRMLNTLHLKDHPQFVHLARSLDVVNHGIATFEGRFPVYEYLAQYGDCVVSHQWENAQNYLYYEALYGGYPLVHNSPMFKDIGYYYPDFDCAAGGRAILEAFDKHDQGLDAYKAAARKLIATLAVDNADNVRAYTEELRRL